MKILMITSVRFRQNGITSVIMSYYQNLIRKADKIDILGPNEIDDNYREIFAANRSVYFQLAYRKKRPIKYCASLYRILKKEKYDIVHVHGSSHSITLELLIARLSKIKVRIAHSHNTKCDHGFFHFLLTPVFNISYTLGLACSEAAGKWMFQNKKFDVINNGIDLQKFSFHLNTREKLQNELNIAETDFVIGNIAGFLPVKNQKFIIQLAEKLLAKNTNYKFLLLGDGKLFQDIQDLVSMKGLNEHILLLGNRPDAWKYYSVMDLFILPSLYEGLPVVLIEAQANGLRSIISDSITEKVNLTGNIKYMSIEESTDTFEKWSKEIDVLEKNLQNRYNSSVAAIMKLKECGYSAQYNSERLYDLYVHSLDGQWVREGIR